MSTFGGSFRRLAYNLKAVMKTNKTKEQQAVEALKDLGDMLAAVLMTGFMLMVCLGLAKTVVEVVAVIATGDTEAKQQEEVKLLCATMRDGSTSCVDQDAFDRIYGIGKYSKGNCPTYNDRASDGSLCGYRSAEYR